MSRVAMYDVEKYSVFDIQDYLSKKGYETEFVNGELCIKGTDVSVDVPIIDINGLILADIRMETVGIKFEKKKNAILFGKLKRLFGHGPGYSPVRIKDEEKMPGLRQVFT